MYDANVGTITQCDPVRPQKARKYSHILSHQEIHASSTPLAKVSTLVHKIVYITLWRSQHK